jgi:hypothetical protein
MSVLTDLIAPGGGVADLISTVIKRVWPDKEAQQQAQQQFDLQLLQMQQKGELEEFDGQVKLALAQVQVQDDEAKSNRLFIAGAHSFIEWVCGVGLGYQIVARPFLGWASTAWWHVPMPPSLDMQTLGSLITAMLGLGTLKIGANMTQGKK